MTLFGLILNLVAAAILLIWSVKLVQSGIERAYGSRIRRALQQAGSRRVQSATFGLMLAILLQSSTAVAVLTASFASTGLIAPSVGIAAVLGADLGSALVVQILSFNLSWLIPIFLIAGGIGVFKGKTPRAKQTGRVLVGIALILISLAMLGEATQPLQHNTFVPLAVDYLKADPLTAFLVGGIFTWLIHSSIAALLLIIAFLAQGIIPFDVAVALVLGANVGGALIAVILTREADKTARLVTVGNLWLRGMVAVLILIAVQIWPVPEKFIEDANVHYLVGFHVGLNFALVVLGLPLVRRVELILDKLISSDNSATNGVGANRPSVLENEKIHIPTHALTSTTRELLYLSELVQKMFEPVMELFEKWDKPLIDDLQALELEHYPQMTEKALQGIVAQAQQRWPLAAVTVIHRVGYLRVNEQIVFVGVASGHRDAAFAATSFIMDYLKTKAPFWKKEHYAEGSRWVAAKDSDTVAANRWE